MSKFGQYRKYKNVKTVYKGVEYDSQLEAKVAQELDWRKGAGEILKIRRQVKCPLYGLNRTKICVHVVDFVVLLADGVTKEVHEAKGPVTPGWRLKLKLFIDNYPKVAYYTHFKDWVCQGAMKRKPGGKGMARVNKQGKETLERANTEGGRTRQHQTTKVSR